MGTWETIDTPESQRRFEDNYRDEEETSEQVPFFACNSNSFKNVQIKCLYVPTNRKIVHDTWNGFRKTDILIRLLGYPLKVLARRFFVIRTTEELSPCVKTWLFNFLHGTWLPVMTIRNSNKHLITYLVNLTFWTSNTIALYAVTITMLFLRYIINPLSPSVRYIGHLVPALILPS